MYVCECMCVCARRGVFERRPRNALYLRRILITFILSSENLFPAKKKRGAREEWTCPLAFPGYLGGVRGIQRDEVLRGGWIGGGWVGGWLDGWGRIGVVEND